MAINTEPKVKIEHVAVYRWQCPACGNIHYLDNDRQVYFTVVCDACGSTWAVTNKWMEG